MRIPRMVPETSCIYAIGVVSCPGPKYRALKIIPQTKPITAPIISVLAIVASLSDISDVDNINTAKKLNANRYNRWINMKL